MTKRSELQPAEFIMPLNMDGLAGRMLVLPAPRQHRREILFVYGHHSTIERWTGLLQELNKYGAVTVPDLPGFGGMQSLYTIGQKPTLDTLADYLAAFIKLRYKQRRINIVGASFGFVIATRMLQRYPDVAKKVDLLVSVVGFAHYDDFSFDRRQLLLYRAAARTLSQRFPAWFVKHTVMQPFMLRPIYHAGRHRLEKFRKLDDETFEATVAAEIELWQASDVRTHLATSLAMLHVDNCRSSVGLPLWHVSLRHDRYLDAHRVEQHLRVIFNDVELLESRFTDHPTGVMTDTKGLAALIPPKLRQQFRQG